MTALTAAARGVPVRHEQLQHRDPYTDPGFRRRSLAACIDDRGVNEELAPWVRMSVPATARGQRLADAPVGREAFTSVLLLFGIFPFYVHHLTLARLYRRGFDEDS